LRKKIKKSAKLSFTGHLITGLCALLFLIALGLILVLSARQLYYFDIVHLNIVENSGYSREEILLNYNALMDWCMPWVTSDFSLPSFPSSANAVVHFQEVKAVFNAVLIAGAASAAALVFLLLLSAGPGKRTRYNVAGLLTLALPAAAGIYAASDFNRAFVLFHDIVFRNDLWIFDYQTDPIISILPEAYFMHCAAVILGIVIMGAAGLFALGRRKNL
jgi:integral membrane protein (TIGR01906 family)